MFAEKMALFILVDTLNISDTSIHYSSLVIEIAEC